MFSLRFCLQFEQTVFLAFDPNSSHFIGAGVVNPKVILYKTPIEMVSDDKEIFLSDYTGGIR